MHNNKMKFYTTKKEMYEDVNDEEIAVYAAKDIVKNEAWKSFCCFKTREDFEEFLKMDNNLYEIIKSDRRMNSYFDLDGEIKQIQNLCRKMNIQSDDLEQYIIEIFKNLIDGWKEDNGFPVDEDEYVILSATKYRNAEFKVGGKFSLHIIDKTVKLENYEESKIYHSQLLKSIREECDKEFNLLNCLIDDKVYTTDRLMRCVNQSKLKEGAKELILLEGEETDLCASLISINESYIPRTIWPSVSIPKKWRRVKLKTLPVIPKKEEDLTNNETEEINILLDNINDDRFTDFEKWRSMLWCLFACGVSLKDIHLQSSLRCPEKYNYEENQNKLNEFNSEKSHYSIQTLRAWAKQDTGYEVQRHFEKKKKEQSINKENHFQFLNLLKKYNGKVFVNDVGLEDFFHDVSSCVQMICGSSTTFCVYVNDDEDFSITKNLVNLNFVLKYEYDDEKQNNCKNWNLQNYMINDPLSFPLYNKLVFKPENHGLKDNELNICSFFKAQQLDKSKIDMNIVNVFTNHIKEIWASGDDSHYKYLMSWIAQIIKTPFKKTEVAILLQGGQGSGKTLPCDILLRHVFGMNLGLSASGLNALTQRFNGCVLGKLFTKVDELSIVTESFNSSFDTMKALITDRNLQIEKKGLEHIQIDNYNNFILTTNHRHTVKLERDDRRYACFSVSDAYKQDEDYFANFMDILDNQNAGNHIYTYFRNYPDEEMVNVRKIPKTELRDDLIQMSKNNIERFIAEMDDEIDDALLYDWKGKQNEPAITCSNFYEYYKIWCNTVGEKAWSKKAVSLELINSKLYKYQGRSQINGLKKTFFVF